MKSAGRVRHQSLPASGPERELLRKKGQFWTPDWVAGAMVRYVLSSGADEVFDPAIGEGVFFRAAIQLNRAIRLAGRELDWDLLRKTLSEIHVMEGPAGIRCGDFLAETVKFGERSGGDLSAIVANPPYIRHHRLAPDVKLSLQHYGRGLIGVPLDGRAGYHIYFLLGALSRLRIGGRLCFIMPADTVEGVFAPTLWWWITRNFRLDAVITFSPDATPFPGVDTNPLVFMIRNDNPASEFVWARCKQPETTELFEFVSSDFQLRPPSVEVQTRDIQEALATGISRPQQAKHQGAVLSNYATVMRGIVTGNNEFFFLTRQRAKELGLPNEWLKPAIGRTRDLLGDQDEVTDDTIEELDRAGRPTLLFAPDGRPLHQFPDSVRSYIELGERLGVNKCPLISLRKPWYKMEHREPPPFLFAYLGRRRARFIRNRAGVVPLTSFLCVYPRTQDAEHIEWLWKILCDPVTVENLARVGKSYGDGAIKVEPRALERLPLPYLPCDEQIVCEASPGQGVLFF